MNTLDRIQQQLQRQLDSAFGAIRDAVDKTCVSVSRLVDAEESFVVFPEDLPCTVRTSRGATRLEPIAFAMFRYCWFVYELEGREEIPFAELGEKVYLDALKPKSTIQNTVTRGAAVTKIGVAYFYSGEFVFIRANATDKKQNRLT